MRSTRGCSRDIDDNELFLRSSVSPPRLLLDTSGYALTMCYTEYHHLGAQLEVGDPCEPRIFGEGAPPARTTTLAVRGGSSRGTAASTEEPP